MARSAPGGRVIVVVPDLPHPPVGGGHKRTLRLLEAIEASGGTPHVVTTACSTPDGIEALRARGWGVDAFEEPGTLRGRVRQHITRLPSPYVPAVAARVRELVREGAAFVQAEHTQSACYARAFDGTPWVLSLHNVDSQLWRRVAAAERPLGRGWISARNRSSAHGAVERRAVPRAHAVLCVSEADRSKLTRLGADPLLVPNGVDDSFFDVPATPPGDERILFFGQYDYVPNASGLARFLQEGWPRLLSRRPGARLILAGTGMGSELQGIASGAAGVDALGFVERIEDELAACSFTIAPLWEGGGTRLKVVESLAAARTVVGTSLAVEGVGFEHLRHGIVAETPAALADAAADLLERAELAERLAAEGRELARSFRWSEATRPAIAAYKRFLGTD